MGRALAWLHGMRRAGLILQQQHERGCQPQNRHHKKDLIQPGTIQPRTNQPRICLRIFLFYSL
jgi:hypothetical protein